MAFSCSTISASAMYKLATNDIVVFILQIYSECIQMVFKLGNRIGDKSTEILLFEEIK